MIWGILGCILYIIVGIFVCEKYGVLDFMNDDDILDTIIDSIMIAFWPIIVLFKFLSEL